VLTTYLQLRRTTIRIAAFAALSVSLIHGALFAQSAPPPFPLRQIVAGDRLLVLGTDRQLWARPLPAGAGSAWQVITLPTGTGQIDGMYCAPDDSGNCALRLGVGPEAPVGLLPARAAAVVATGVPASRMYGFVDATTLYFGRHTGPGRTTVYAYDTSRRRARAIATIARDETVETVMLDGRPTLVARGPDRSGRTLDRNPAIAIPGDLPENLLNTRYGMIAVGSWRDAWASDPQAQNMLLLNLVSDGRGGAKVERTILGALPVTSLLIDPGSLVTDASGDVYGTATSASGRLTVILCRGEGGGLSIGHLRPIPRGVAVQLFASASGNGAIVVQSAAGYSPRISVLRLAEPSPAGFRTRPCHGTAVRVDDSGIRTEDSSADWIVQVRSVAASDGTPLTYVLLRPKNHPVERLIVHAYGAYGLVPDNNGLLPSILDHLLRQRTAIAFVTVRGDGHAGIAAAMASRTPNRQRAVDDLIAVTEHINQEFPGLTGHATAQGRSAGAWLAMQAALQRPDLFAGAIGFSGAYIFADDPQVTEASRFFGPDDSFDRNGLVERANCTRQHFRLLHARNDRIVGFDQAERFAAMLNARGCPAELVPFASGGHAISVTYGTDNVERLISAYYTPFDSRSEDSASPAQPRR